METCLFAGPSRVKEGRVEICYIYCKNLLVCNLISLLDLDLSPLDVANISSNV